jgi:hypothetical protein
MGLSSLAGSCSPASGHFKAADTEADPAMSFGALLKLERYTRIDLGAIIDLPWQAILARLWESTKPSTRPMRMARDPQLAGTTLRRRQNPICAERKGHAALRQGVVERRRRR